MGRCHSSLPHVGNEPDIPPATVQPKREFSTCQVALSAAIAHLRRIKRGDAVVPVMDRSPMQTLRLGSTVTFHYTNLQGQREARRVVLLGLQFGVNPEYSDPVWLLQTFDIGREGFRSFDLARIDATTLKVEQ